MRHQLTNRFVVVLTVALVIAVVVWSGLARTVVTSDQQDCSGTALSLTGDVDRELLRETDGDCPAGRGRLRADS